MKRAGVRNQAVADATGVHVKTVSKWLNGVFEPENGALIAIAELLDVPVAWLRYGEDAPSAPALSGGALSTQERSELPPDVAKAARRLVDAFKREAAVAGASPEELHYIETVLMTPQLPPTLVGGAVAPERLLEHIQAMMEPLRVLLRDLGRKI
jgi:transcriptional regulator with XRE-family HTH domain